MGWKAVLTDSVKMTLWRQLPQLHCRDLNVAWGGPRHFPIR